MKTLIIIPTYNERDNIRDLITSIYQIISDIDVLVVDDNSPDGTGEVVKSLAQLNKRINLLIKSGKYGMGRAYVDGFNWALKYNYDAFITMDADMSHNPIYIPQLIRGLEEFDVVVGSRWFKSWGIRDWPLFRVLISKGAAAIARLMLNIPIQDFTGGFNCYRKKVIKVIDPQRIKSDGYGFQIEMKYLAFINNFKIKEIPIIFHDRSKGISKFSGSIVLEAISLLFRLRAND